MGGTTAKLCVIDGGQPLHSRTFEVARSYRFKQGSGLPVRIPVIEMVEIGAGGGSIAGVDALERIQVGPASAGSEPGPAAYSRGGDEPTVTDADVVLGRIDPEFFAGGSIPLDRGRSEAAIEARVGDELGLDAKLAALGISEMVDENMSNAARTHAIEWGKGVAGRTLIAFGGSAPIHAARLADKLEVNRFLVPADAGVGSAVGFLLAPISYEVVRSRYMRLSGFDPDIVGTVFDEMRDEAEAVVSRGAPGTATTGKARAYMRYVGQGHEIGVDLPETIKDAAALREAFDRGYETVYGRTIPGLDIEILSWTLVVSAPATEAADVPAGTSPRALTPPVGQLAEADVPAGTSPDEQVEGQPAPTGPTPERRTELWDGPGGESMTAAVHTREALAEGTRVEGPALIAEDQTTTVVPDGWDARVVRGGHLFVERRAASDAAASGAQAGIASLEGQIMWSRLLSVVEEQARTLVRTAFSTPVREAGDLSAGVFDLSGRMLAQAVTGTPGHVNAMAASVGFFLRDFPVETLGEDDVLITNDPWEGTGHLNDFTVVTPTFLDGRPVALFAATSHIADVGGRGFGADANQVFEEGIRLPIGYLIRGGRVDETLMRLVRANVRDPDVAQGDLYSLAACNRTGCERLVAMMTEFGIDSLQPLAETIITTSRRAMRERIGALRPGTYRNRMRIDGYDEDLDLVCALTVLPDGTIRIDWDGTSPMSSRGINVPVTYTRAYSSFGVRCIVGSEVPNNAGSLAAIEVSAPPGSLLNAPRPPPSPRATRSGRCYRTSYSAASSRRWRREPCPPKAPRASGIPSSWRARD